MNVPIERVVCINLKRRPDRWVSLQDDLRRGGWCFAPPQRFEAICGDVTGHPAWFRAGNGAWGCLISHARVFEEAMHDESEAVCILEDDAVLAGNFRVLAPQFIEAVPEDWDIIYLGGQHLKDPEPVNGLVYRGLNINRTHAHIYRKGAIARVYQHIMHAPDYVAHGAWHIDHQLGLLHERRELNVYTPVKWLVGQRTGSSDVSGRWNKTYFWNTWTDVPKAPLLVAADSSTAGLMVKAGLHFGYTLVGMGIDKGLDTLCTDQEGMGNAKRNRWHQWAMTIQREAADIGTLMGAWHPEMKLHELVEVWPGTVVVEGWDRVMEQCHKAGFYPAVDPNQSHPPIDVHV
jgi:hypothetical protein